MHTVHTVLLQWLRPEKHCHLQETLVCLRLCVCECVSVEETKKNLGESGEETDKQTQKQKEIDSERNLVKFHPAAWLENLENTHHRAVACGSWAAQSPKCSNTHTHIQHTRWDRTPKSKGGLDSLSRHVGSKRKQTWKNIPAGQHKNKPAAVGLPQKTDDAHLK